MIKQILISIGILFIVSSNLFSQDYEKIFESNLTDIFILFKDKGYEYKGSTPVEGKKLVTVKFETSSVENSNEFLMYWLTYNGTNVDEIVIMTSEFTIYDLYQKMCASKMANLSDVFDAEYAYGGEKYTFVFHEKLIKGVTCYVVQIMKRTK